MSKQTTQAQKYHNVCVVESMVMVLQISAEVGILWALWFMDSLFTHGITHAKDAMVRNRIKCKLIYMTICDFNHNTK